MPVMEYSDIKINLDNDGYLENPYDWNEKVACALAEREGVEGLSKDRMEIIRFLREYYMRYISSRSSTFTSTGNVQPDDAWTLLQSGKWRDFQNQMNR